jgi:hypothetical protein
MQYRLVAILLAAVAWPAQGLHAEVVTVRCFAAQVGDRGTNYTFEIDLAAQTVLYATGSQPRRYPVRIDDGFVHWGPDRTAGIPVNRLSRRSLDLMIADSMNGPWSQFATCERKKDGF